MRYRYEVNMQDGEEIEVEGAMEVRQNFGFVEFRDENEDLVIAIRADQIRSYKLGATVTVPAQVTLRKKQR